MSRRRSDPAAQLAAIEALVCRDIGRNTQKLIEANRGGLASAAISLASATSVGLITGFAVPQGGKAAPETDGPVGAALLAAALVACGVPSRIAVDSPCGAAVRTAAAAAGGGVPIDEVAVDDADSVATCVEVWRKVGVSHALAIERCGRSADGRPRNMRGIDVSPWTAPLDDLFLGGNWVRIAVGDGGNEIGMGKLPFGLIAESVPMGAEIASVTGCNHLVVAGVSNWGAYGLMASLAVLRPDWAPVVRDYLTAALDRSVTQTMVNEAGAIDGVTGRHEATVDGLAAEVHAKLIEDLRRIACAQGAD